MKFCFKKLCVALLTLGLVVTGCFAMSPLEAYADVALTEKIITVTPANISDYLYDASNRDDNKPFSVSGTTVELKRCRGYVHYNIHISGDWSGYSFTVENAGSVSSFLPDYTVDADAIVDRVSNNKGFIHNYGKIVNGCTLSNSIINYGYMGRVEGQMSENYGTIDRLGGILGENKASGRINTVEYNGKVNTNNGFIDVIEDSDSTSYGVMDNYGVVGHNHGHVHNNKDTGMVLYNYDDGSVSDNYGKISQNAGAVDINRTSASIYGNTNPACEALGGVVTSGQDPQLPALLALYYPQEPDFDPAADAIERYRKTLDNLTSDFENAAKVYELSDNKNNTITIYYNIGSALPLEVFTTLKKCDGVSLDYRCEYEGKPFHYIIKGGKNMKIDETVEWYGVYFLAKMYGTVAD